MIASVVALASLPVAAGLMGGVALLGAAGFALWTPKFLPRRER